MKTTNKEFSLKLTYKEEIDRCTSSSNIIIRFYPHQSNPLGLGSKYDPYFTKEKIENLPCICQKNNNDSWYDFLTNTLKKDQTSTLWINPSSMPISCFLSCVDAWKRYSSTAVDNAILGIFIPKASKECESKEKASLWSSDKRGPVEHKTAIKNVIWYPCLAHSNVELLFHSSTLKSFEIFPITEVINQTPDGVKFDMSKHKLLLDGNKVRTEKIMYINRKTPNETFGYLVNSIQHLPRRPAITTPVVTPGGVPINYISVALAAAITDTLLLLNMNESFLEPLTNDCFILKCEA